MKSFEQFLVPSNNLVIDALKALSRQAKGPMTLFVSEKDKVIGSLTDGDIRRALINGVSLSAPVSEVMHKEFKYLSDSEIDINLLKKFKNDNINLVPILDKNHKIIDILNLKQIRSYLPIDAVLMAGGRGERLRPLTEKTPKPLLKVGEKAIIDYNVERLISYGVKHINVTVNYLKEQIEEHFSQPYTDDINVNCISEPLFLGTIGSVKFVPYFYNDTVLIMNSDLFTNINFEDFYLHFIEHEADMSVAAIPYNISVPLGIFELNGREIKGIKEKPTYNYYANAGIYLIKRKHLDKIPENTHFDATDLIELLVKEKCNVIRFPITGYWIDIGKPEEYRRAQEFARHIKD